MTCLSIIKPFAECPQNRKSKAVHHRRSSLSLMLLLPSHHSSEAVSQRPSLVAHALPRSHVLVGVGKAALFMLALRAASEISSSLSGVGMYAYSFKLVGLAGVWPTVHQ
jgi:hypothetical protein